MVDVSPFVYLASCNTWKGEYLKQVWFQIASCGHKGTIPFAMGSMAHVSLIICCLISNYYLQRFDWN